MNISGNTIFIPGATSGIGLGLALRLQERGNTVIIGGRRAALLEEIRTGHPGIDTVVIDTASPASIAEAYDTVLSRHPELDTLITMAGIMLPEDITDPESLRIAEQTVETNLLGPIRLVYQFLPALLKRERATIMTVSSGLAYVPLPVTPTYSATKAAIHSFTEAIRVQLRGSSVQLIELAPPAVRTALMGQEEAPNAMPLEEYLDEVMTLIEKNPDDSRVLVERVKWLSDAVAEGRYQDVLEALSGHRS